jgi:hypothetical protein
MLGWRLAQGKLSVTADDIHDVVADCAIAHPL